ncbi:3-phosphoserine/phosphohydroxythreonine transaminase [uncultured Umboniibacter sp.]|uniref:3-phosphoserine/phosphohydroxythreonine transaminase n=1 Tax=uncultured Umboniibacter sp. TaxID=1798917 RepID=UPI003439737F
MRAFNFCAGPASLPTAVLEQAQAELLDYQSSGVSIMEVSHRGDLFMSVLASAKARLRRLMKLPESHDILFMQGGATAQFSLIPSHFLHGVGAYVNSGQWSIKAIEAAKRFGDVQVLASSEEANFSYMPPQASWDKLSANADYLHYTPNETIGGVRSPFIPQVDVPLIADFSSSILSETIDASKFDFIYAGAQKNIGPAGVVVVIVKRELLKTAREQASPVFDYSKMLSADSMVNTPPTYSIYLADLVFKWLEEQGGVSAMEAINNQKAASLYDCIDNSGFYRNPVALSDRSKMNVPFILADDRLDATFLAESEAAGLKSLAGHRSVGGMRASLYNAMPLSGVNALTEFMRDFERRYG